MSWAEILQRKVTRRETIELGRKAAVGLALAACAPAASAPDNTSPQSSLRVDTSAQYEVSAKLQGEDLAKALKKHAMTAAQAIVFDGRIDSFLPFLTVEMQNQIVTSPQFRDGFQRTLMSYTRCGLEKGVKLSEGSVTPGRDGGKVVSVLFDKTCSTGIEALLPGYDLAPRPTIIPMTYNQIGFVYQLVDETKYKIARLAG